MRSSITVSPPTPKLIVGLTAVTLLCTGSSSIPQRTELWSGTLSVAGAAKGEPEQVADPVDRYASAFIQASRRQGRLRAVVRFANEELPDCWDGPLRLVLIERDREIYDYVYCSEYGLGGARAVTDARGRTYVFVEHGEGRGTRATTMYLTVYRFADHLHERSRLMVRQPVGMYADAVLDYRVDTPASGGIVVRGSWTVHGEPWPREPMTPEGTTVVTIDTAA